MGDLSWLIQRPVAHRGLHDASCGVIENSPSAVEAAIAAGFSVEVDIQLARDGEAMVYHDFVLDRLTQGAGPLAQQSRAQLEQVRFRATDDRMMSLPDLLARVDGRAPLLIEIKSAFTGDVRLALRAASLLAGYRGPAALMSFDPEMLSAVRDAAPDLTRGIVAERRYVHGEWDGLSAGTKRVLRHLLHWPKTRFQFIAYRAADLPVPPIRLARALGFPVLAWTVRRPADWEAAKTFADQMIFEGFRP
ncbi:glycerophosphodiester phosphodiesterase family protein [Roseixanthobacter glucoisosaccharinicivorans]|uniref:glycerophosphodiester phosphodiesterase family protein n=1 Tax=Roseixanthobacter glucoisosaccharinicivorans TaxID=3119923 RepID=UPI00372AA0D8